MIDPPTPEAVERRLNRLPNNEARLIFVGKDWERKGGQVSVELAQLLQSRQIPVKLRIVGCHPPKPACDYSFVEICGFLDKSSPADRQKLYNAMMDSHFLVMFSHADASPIALCEANAFGIPVVTSAVGGMPAIVSEDVNGRAFPIPVDLTAVSNFIAPLIFDRKRYKELSLKSRQHYDRFLNWDVAGEQLHSVIRSSVCNPL